MNQQGYYVFVQGVFENILDAFYLSSWKSLAVTVRVMCLLQDSGVRHTDDIAHPIELINQEQLLDANDDNIIYVLYFLMTEVEMFFTVEWR